MRQKFHRVGPDSVRPAGLPDRCFYCQAILGEEHNAGCVLRRKTVVVDFTVRLVVTMPEDWSPDHVEFYYNDGTWCADGLISLLEKRRLVPKPGCLCDRVKAVFAREATEADEEKYGVVE